MVTNRPGGWDIFNVNEDGTEVHVTPNYDSREHLPYMSCECQPEVTLEARQYSEGDFTVAYTVAHQGFVPDAQVYHPDFFRPHR